MPTTSNYLLRTVYIDDHVDRAPTAHALATGQTKAVAFRRWLDLGIRVARRGQRTPVPAPTSPLILETVYLDHQGGRPHSHRGIRLARQTERRSSSIRARRTRSQLGRPRCCLAATRVALPCGAKPLTCGTFPHFDGWVGAFTRPNGRCPLYGEPLYNATHPWPQRKPSPSASGSRPDSRRSWKPLRHTRTEVSRTCWRPCCSLTARSRASKSPRPR